MEEKKFVVVIPSYNNAKWYEKNILSVNNQNYNNFRVIYTDDCSQDNTGNLVENFILDNNLEKISLIRNPQRLGALHNLYNMIHSCADDEIIVTCDGDDFLANNDVLNRLNQEYQNPNVWLTWGSYFDYPGMTRGCSRPFPQHIIDKHAYHAHPWCMSHLRTFYAGLFKKIKKEDLYYNGKFAEMGWDVIFMLKLAQMAGGRFSYIDDILYLYNNENPISDHRVNQRLQGTIDRYARTQKPYAKLDKLF